ncbi:MAG: YceH family protein [Thermoleophilaceae bacterium]
MDLGPVEIRVLGCLVEKQRTTPDAYPLTLNALRLACNQSTNRDPVVDYEEGAIRDAAQSLGRRRLARLASGHTTRTTKYRHLLDEALGLPPGELAVLGLLMLRGAQTPGELKGRADRLHAFADLAGVEEALDGLIGRGHAARLERRPGQKEQRYAHLLGADADAVAAEVPVPAPQAEPAAPPPPAGPGLDERVARVEAEVAELRAALDALRRDLGA